MKNLTAFTLLMLINTFAANAEEVSDDILIALSMQIIHEQTVKGADFCKDNHPGLDVDYLRSCR